MRLFCQCTRLLDASLARPRGYLVVTTTATGGAGLAPAARGMASLTFVGTATAVLNLGGVTLLTDPNFLHKGQRVYLGYGLFSKRRSEPAMQPPDLPGLDGVVLSHLHGDYFDRVAKKALDHALPVVTTPHAARRLRRWGFRESVPLETLRNLRAQRGNERVRITSVPGTVSGWRAPVRDYTSTSSGATRTVATSPTFPTCLAARPLAPRPTGPWPR